MAASKSRFLRLVFLVGVAPLVACGSTSTDGAGGASAQTTAVTGGRSNPNLPSGGTEAQSSSSTTGGAPQGTGASGTTGGASVAGTGGAATGGSATKATGGSASGGTAGATGGATSMGGATTIAAGGSSQMATSSVATGGVKTATGGGPSATGGSVAAGGTTAQAAGGTIAAAGSAQGGSSSVLPPTTDYTAPGPFATATDNNVGPDGKCTVFRPKTLGENGFLHAPIVFGPGIGMQATQLKDLLLSFASHGFVVVGTGVLNGGPNDPGNRTAMQNALNWIIQQNSQAGIYQGKLDIKHAVSMGYSVGGTAAVEVGAHEAVATTVSIHGHVASSSLHGPLLQTSGTKDTVGLPMQQQTFEKSQVQTFLGTVTNADHGYIQSNSGGVERPAIIAWLRYWIYGDNGAKRYFWGNDCVLCSSPWTNPQRKNWQ